MALIGLSLLLGCTSNQTVSRDNIDISAQAIRSGIFDYRMTAKRYATLGFGIVQEQFADLKFLKQTDDIPAREGVMFGVDLRVQANWGRKLQVAEVWLHPPWIDPDTQESVDYTAEGIYELRNGERITFFYPLLYPHEVVPGEWRLVLTLIGVDDEMADINELHNPPFAKIFYEHAFELVESNDSPE